MLGLIVGLLFQTICSVVEMWPPPLRPHRESHIKSLLRSNPSVLHAPGLPRLITCPLSVSHARVCVHTCTDAPPPAPRPHAHTRTHTRACNLPKSPSAGVNPQCAIPFIALSACTSASDFVTQLQQASAAHGSLEVPNPSSIHIPNPHTGLPCSYLKITIMFFSDIDIIVLFDIRTTFGLMIWQWLCFPATGSILSQRNFFSPRLNL